MAPLILDENLAMEPVVIQFSLYGLQAHNSTSHRSLVLETIREHVLCQSGFHVIGNDRNTSTLFDHVNDDIHDDVCSPYACIDDIMNVTTASFDRTSLNVIDQDLTILREAPILVVDRDSEDLQWTSWTLYYDVIQVGQTLQDMAWIGSGMEDEDNNTILVVEEENNLSNFIASVQDTADGGLQILFDYTNNEEENHQRPSSFASMTTTNLIHWTVNNLLQLALKVNIMEGTLDNDIQQHFPQARFSLAGDEVIIFSNETAPQDNKVAPDSTTIVADDKMSSSMSTVAMSMYKSQSLRNCGLVMLINTLMLLWSLVHTAVAKRRRLHQQYHTPEPFPQNVTLVSNKKKKRKRRKSKHNTFRTASIVMIAFLLPLVTSMSDKPPNFVIILTDDLDWTLGGANASTLTRTRKYIAQEGVTFSNWFVQTPVCCPSRAELLTGKLFHNLRMSDEAITGCMHVNVTDDASHPFYSRDYFAPFFSRNTTLNYNVGVFGKHLNSYNPSNFILPGVDEMLINNGGEYLDPTFTFGNGTDESVRDIHFNTCKDQTGMPCYSTSILGNVSLSWIERQVKEPPSLRPFMALISVKAPHIKDAGGYSMSIPAPWYEGTIIEESMAPRTPNYNYSGSPDHHWLVRSQPPMTQEEGEKVDELYVLRLKTLISVDDLVEELIQKLTQWEVLDNTYVIFTSDNGYRLGQFRMPINKLHPYENDIRVPMMMRGPGIARNTTTSLVSTHVNLMPTLMGFATKQYDSQDVVPSTMDGMNLAAKILNLEANTINETDQGLSKFDSSSVLVEYASLGNLVIYNHLIDTYNHSFVALRILDTDPAHYPLQNLKYVEFRDSRNDWNMTKNPLERELYDVDQDPYEMHNIVEEVSPILVEALSNKIQKMIQCQGALCRQEHSSGLEVFWSSESPFEGT